MLLRVARLLRQLSGELCLVAVLVNSHQTGLLLVRWSRRGRRSLSGQQMGRCVRDRVVDGQVLDLFGEHLDGLLKVPDHVVLSTAGFGLPSDDFLPQAHHLVAHVLDKILVLLSIRGKQSLRHSVFDLSLYQGTGVGREGSGNLRRHFRSQEDAFDLSGDAL